MSRSPIERAIERAKKQARRSYKRMEKWQKRNEREKAHAEKALEKHPARNCPLCGSTELLITRGLRLNTWKARCKLCFCRTEDHRTIKGALKEWNGWWR